MNTHIAKNGLVPGPADPNLAMGFEDMSMPADRKASDAGGMGPKAWAPVAQGPAAVGQLGGGAVGMGNPGAGMQQGNPRQAGRGLNKLIPNAANAPGAPNAMGPGGKPNNSRRPNHHNMRGMAGYNAARMAGAGPAGAQAGALANAGGGGGGHGEEMKVPITPNGTPLEGSMLVGKGVSPEWVKQEDTSWVDKLLDMQDFDAS